MFDQLTVCICKYVTEQFPETREIVAAILTYHVVPFDASAEQIEAQLAAAFGSRDSLIKRVDNEYELFSMLLGKLGISETAPKRLEPDGRDNKKAFPVSMPLLWFLTMLFEHHERYERLVSGGAATKMLPRRTVEDMANAFLSTADKIYNSTKNTPTEAAVVATKTHIGQALIYVQRCLTRIRTLKDVASAQQQSVLPSAYAGSNYGTQPPSSKPAW
ncbi:protein ORF95 [Cyprinid herpesvirus 3]|uniref:ORF95L n=1 Tax=Cyprinid herpesvirus 3 TaxID=180230 RepID=A3QMR3_CYHV3|nr:unnamed protein product [Cyprinid herpesvirus 3]ABF81818.1 hypothetical protein [Cyprinid herpesvirus 3]ABG42922.1 protein ORF95 [Cyprinid herpesvirus 3]AIC32450.1 ORF95L [Cyprinid herpesvirus 3]AJP55583.1 protein ORF95 [Cyprinid herpesvirus 3]AJP55738.1 protein ORF95 [Cyprinid herpesvirus 3]